MYRAPNTVPIGACQISLMFHSLFSAVLTSCAGTELEVRDGTPRLTEMEDATYKIINDKPIQ